jgi:hypothetical protein
MSIVILQDHAGYDLRVRALKAVHSKVYSMAPHDKPNNHSFSFAPPPEWLPSHLGMSYSKTCWWKADAMSLAAVQTLSVESGYYWFIESDVVASAARWRALFDDFKDDPSDLVAPMIRTRETRPESWHWHHGPDWSTHYILMAIFRLSHAALIECTRCAVEMRNTFSEVAIPSVIHRAGMSITPLNIRQTHCNTQTFCADPKRVIINPLLMNHPVKSNTLHVPGSISCPARNDS